MGVSSIIKSLIDAKKIQQKKLASVLGVGQATVSHWVSGRQEPNPSQRKKLCDFFGITEPELFGPNNAKSPFEISKIPVISWVHANQFETISDPFPVGVADEYIYSDIKGENIFALRVQSSCMESEFYEGDIIIVKPSVHVTSGDFVIVADRQSNSATFKQYKEYGKKKILHPLNPKFKDIELDHKKQYVIVGKVVAKQKKY